MKSGISKYLLLSLFVLQTCLLFAQRDSARYDRPSLCMLMVARPETGYNSDIETVFRQMDMPDRFNDHSLGVRVFKIPSDGTETLISLTAFADKAEIAKKMVSKWFGRNKTTGCFNTSLIAQRGLYNADKIEADIAAQIIRGNAMLEDAGEKLISHTFLVVNEYKYIRNYTNKDGGKQNVKNQDMDMFTISCTSYLFRLNWNDTTAASFYHYYYFDCNHLSEEKARAYMSDRNSYSLSYVGNFTDKLTEHNTQHLPTEQLVRKACVRITDRNLAKLQHAHPEFRIKASLVGTEPLKAYIGLKEDVSPNSKFEVLMPKMHSDGTYTYERVGVIQPIAGKIWDNRYMATDDSHYDLDATYFKQLSGGELYSGLLIREITQ